MPGDPKECRERAARCLEMAAEAANDGIKQMFLNIAKHWEMLAIELERAKSILDDEKGAIRLRSKKKRRKQSAAGRHKPKRKTKPAVVLRQQRLNDTGLWRIG